MKRRDVLRGLGLGAGASVLGPYLSRVIAQAQGGPAPKRLIILLEGDSIHPRRSTPVEVLANLNRVRREQSESEVELSGRFDSRYYINDTPLITEGLTLPRALEPLAGYRDELVMVQGLSHKIGGGGHTGDYSTLSSTQGSRQTPGGSPSIGISGSGIRTALRSPPSRSGSVRCRSMTMAESNRAWFGSTTPPPTA